MTRNEKALSLAGGVWVRERREALGWSAAKLALRTRMMQRCQGLRGRLPSTADILALEAGGLTKLPRWLTLVWRDNYDQRSASIRMSACGPVLVG